METQRKLERKPTASNTIANSRPARGRLAILAALLAALATPASFSAQTNATLKLTAAVNSGQVQLLLSGQPNKIYQIQASTNLVNWTGISQRAGSSNGTVIVTETTPGGYSKRFYRAVSESDLTQVGGDAYASDKILVKPAAGAQLSALNLSVGAQVLSVFPAVGNLHVVKVPHSVTASALIAKYRQSGLVEYAEPDYYLHALATPNDFYYQQGNLWGLHNSGRYGGNTNADIDATDAWNIQNDASGVIVAVIDTGVRYTHEDLAANMWVNPADGSHGTNVVANNPDPDDDYGHGTHVAGTIGAVGNNNVGVVGVAWKTQIMACKFLDSTGNGTIAGAIACMDYARSHGAKIVNASWGTTNFTSQSLHDAIASLRDAGIMFVAAAGNSSSNNDVTPLYPASYRDLDNIIAVAATDMSDSLASFSDYGPTNVDLAAPGLWIFSCWNGSNSDYQFDDGTSMAAAMVSGAVAVMEAHFPSDNYQQIKQRIMANVDPQPSLQGQCVSGGRLNLYRALTGGAPPPPQLTASFTANPTSGQAPLAVQFTDTSTGDPTSWDWNFGDGSAHSASQNPSHTYTNAGSFTASLTVTGSSGQTSGASQLITATNGSSSGQPVITLTAPQPDAYFSGQTSGAVRFHRTGDISQSYTVSWTFSGTGTNGVDYGPLPTSSPFPAGQADADLTITPIDHGQTGDRTVMVTLAPGAAYQAGSPDSATVTIHATPAGATASFTANPTSGQAPLTVQFTDTSTGSPTNWDWNFGDGTAHGTAQNPSHTYTSAGSFTATLTVGGSSASQTITVTNASGPPPVAAAFSANPGSGPAPLTVQFTDQSSGPVAAWNWDFGDGFASTAQNPSHTYTNAGSFTVTLTVTGKSGQSSGVSHTISVSNPPPQPVSASLAANPGSGQAPLTVQFTDQSSGPVTTWNWNFGDGSASSAQNPSHTYNNAGSFTVTLTVSGSSGQSSRTTQTITVTSPSPPVSASFSANPSSGQAPLTVQFTDRSSGPVVSWSWDFGDGSSGSAQNPAHTYNSAGSYTVTLTVANSSGQTSSASHSIAVASPPPPVSAGFSASPTSGQAPLGVQFTDQSSGPVVSWSWDFGDGASSSAQNPAHTYNNAGSYTVTLTVANSAGQTGSVSHTITVTNPAPPPSTVTCVASQSLASLLSPGVFTITRTGDTSSTLTVHYSLSGSVVIGLDYQTLSGSVAIPAGASSATVVVQPEGLLTLLKTVVLTLSPDSSYDVGSPNSATVSILAQIGL